MRQLSGDRPVVFFTLGSYLLAHILLDGQLWVGGVVLTLSSGLAVPFGVVFGMPAAVGLALGVVAKDSLRLVVSTGTLVSALSLFLVSSVAAVYWRHGVRPDAADVTQPRWWFRFGAVVGVASAAGAAFLAWGRELLGIAPFYLAFGRAFTTLLTASLFLTPVVVLPVARSRLSGRLVRRSQPTHDSPPSPHDPSESAHTPPNSAHGPRPTTQRSSRIVLGAVSLLWAGCGLLWSVGFQLRQRTPLAGFERLDVVFLYDAIHPARFGQGGRWAQAVFGVVMLTLLGNALRRSTHSVWMNSD